MRLVCWIGGNDIKAASGESEKAGAIASTINAEDFTALHLLYNYTEAEVTPYVAWLKAQTQAPVCALPSGQWGLLNAISAPLPPLALARPTCNSTARISL